MAHYRGRRGKGYRRNYKKGGRKKLSRKILIPRGGIRL